MNERNETRKGPKRVFFETFLTYGNQDSEDSRLEGPEDPFC